eukprot:scaffold1366_cov91-Cylindrotheca_fusiformis.AAC.3
MVQTTTTTTTKNKKTLLLGSAFDDFKDNLLERIGGASSLDFVVLALCSRIQDDPSLRSFYSASNFTSSDLVALQKEFILAALLKNKEAKAGDALKARVVLAHSHLFEMGFNEVHFDILASHFAGALLDSWQDDDVIRACERHFQELRPIFVQHGSNKSKTTMRMKIQNDGDDDNVPRRVRNPPVQQSDQVLKQILDALEAASNLSDLSIDDYNNAMTNSSMKQHTSNTNRCFTSRQPIQVIDGHKLHS